MYIKWYTIWYSSSPEEEEKEDILLFVLPLLPSSFLQRMLFSFNPKILTVPVSNVTKQVLFFKVSI